MLNLTLIKRLFSLEKAITALCFGGLDLTNLNYPWLSMPADSLMSPIKDRRNSYWKCRHSASGVVRSLQGGLILQIEPSLVIATVTALFRTLRVCFGLGLRSLLFGLRWKLLSLLPLLPPAWAGEPSAQPVSLGSAFLFLHHLLHSFVFGYFLSLSL